MNSIVLSVPELKKIVATLTKDKIDYVQVSLNEGDTADGDTLPPSAAFVGLRASEPEELIDYDELEAVPEAEADFSIL